VVWDDAPSAERFASGMGALLGRRTRPGYRARFERLRVDGRPASRFVMAPASWSRWKALPEVTAAP
jgi:hypothetical protein